LGTGNIPGQQGFAPFTGESIADIQRTVPEHTGADGAISCEGGLGEGEGRAGCQQHPHQSQGHYETSFIENRMLIHFEFLFFLLNVNLVFRHAD
jgi:hypothetical protein